MVAGLNIRNAKTGPLQFKVSRKAGTECIGIAMYCNMKFQSCIGVASKIAYGIVM